MKPPHHCDTKAYTDYYVQQAGRGYPVYAGSRFQRGHGLGSVFGGLFKAAAPLLKKRAKALGREALKTGLNIAGDVVQGKKLKQAAQSRVKAAGKNMFNQAIRYASPPGERAIKRLAPKKRVRRRQTRQRNTSEDIFG